MKRLINRAAVRDAFHLQGARVPRGFIGHLEQAIYVILRRAAAGEIKPSLDTQIPTPAYLKQSLLREALRDALGKDRVETAWVAHFNAIIGLKVSEAAVRGGARIASAPMGVGVPGRMVRSFLRSNESRRMTLSTFLRRWQNAEFRRDWEDRTEAATRPRERTSPETHPSQRYQSPE